MFWLLWLGNFSVIYDKYVYIYFEQTIASRKNIPYTFPAPATLARYLNEAESNGTFSALQDLSQNTIYNLALPDILGIRKEPSVL